MAVGGVKGVRVGAQAARVRAAAAMDVRRAGGVCTALEDGLDAI